MPSLLPALQNLLRRQPESLAALSWMPGRAPLPIGVDLGGDAVRMMQLAVEDDGPPRVVNLARRNLREDAAQAAQTAHGYSWEAAGEIVSDLLRRGGFRGRQVVVSLPRAMTRFKTVRLPAGARGEALRHLAQEAQAAFGIDLTDGKWITHFLPGEPLRRGEGREGILAVARRDDVEHFVSRLHEWGAEVAGIDLEPLALYRSTERFGRRMRDKLDAVVVADVGARATRIVVGRGPTISFYKPLQTGGRAIQAAVAQALGLSVAEADLLCRRENRDRRDTDLVARTIHNARRVVVEDLARELSLCMRYYAVTFKGRPPARVVLCGGAADEPLRAALADALLPILPLTVAPRAPLRDLSFVGPAEVLADVVSEGDGGNEWSLALGLALRQVSNSFAPVRGATRAEQTRREQEELEADDTPMLTAALPEPMPTELEATPWA